MAQNIIAVDVPVSGANVEKQFNSISFNSTILDAYSPIFEKLYNALPNMYISVKGHRINLLDARVKISNSNTVRLVLSGPDKALLDHLLSNTSPTVSIVKPTINEILSSSFTAKFNVENIQLGESTSNYLSISVDGGAAQISYADVFEISGLTSGQHTLDVQIYENGVALLNPGSETSSEFLVGTISEPYLTITMPHPNQTYSAPPVSVEFVSGNFPILSNDQHLRYSVDGGDEVGHYSVDPILIDNLDPGKHEIRIFMADTNGSNLGYQYGDVTFDVMVGNNIDSVATFNIRGSAIDNVEQTSENVNVGNYNYTDTYAPIDVQFIDPDNQKLGSAIDQPTVLVAQLNYYRQEDETETNETEEEG